jgi:squalene-hopene/tetraprenyl-beta-curcumene cyclase
MTDGPAEPSAGEQASAAVQRATRILLVRQDSRGRWSGRSAGDVSLDAEALLVREFLGVRTAEATSAVAQQIRSVQQPDGSWIGGHEPDGTGDLSASTLAYLALRLAGDSADAYHLAVAAGWIRDAGGIEAAGLVARCWLAMFGLIGWAEVGVPAAEFVFLPARYAPARGQWAGWSRQVVISLTIIGTLQPRWRLPVDVNELRATHGDAAQPLVGPPAALSAAQRVALRKSGQWLVDWQQRAGLPARGRPYWPCALVALHALGYSLAHPVLSEGLAWLDSATARARRPGGRVPPRPERMEAERMATEQTEAEQTEAGRIEAGRIEAGRIEAGRMPPVRDTAFAVRALADAGLPASHPALTAAGSWLLAQRIEGPSDPTGPWFGGAASGWSFGRDGYPVAADTAEVLLTLSRINLAGLTGKPAIIHAIRWLTDVQCRDGSWGHSAAATALVVQALATHGALNAAALRRGVVWLLRAQLRDGSWPGLASRPELTATTMVLTALLVAGVLPGKPAISKCIRWLLSQQNPDAGWPAAAAGNMLQPSASSDPAATARVIGALAAVAGATAVAGEAVITAEMTGAAEITGAVERGVAWLVRAQHADGGWSERAGSDKTGSARGGSGRAGNGRGGSDRTGGGGAGSGGNRRERGPAPASRYAQRRRGSLIPGLLLPLGALGQVIAAGRGGPDERPGWQQGPWPLAEPGLSGVMGVSQ